MFLVWLLAARTSGQPGHLKVRGEIVPFFSSRLLFVKRADGNAVVLHGERQRQADRNGEGQTDKQTETIGRRESVG